MLSMKESCSIAACARQETPVFRNIRIYNDVEELWALAIKELHDIQLKSPG